MTAARGASTPTHERVARPRSLAQLRVVAGTCMSCPLHEHATQTVFGEGPARARVVLIGEQPGDQEDREGRPFVGPAGRVLDDAFHDSGIDRGSVYLTNVVKHFKWRASDARHIHRRPNAQEIRACDTWWKAELELVGPEFVVCLGSIAAKTLLGDAFRLTRHRGEWQSLDNRKVLATVHPSAVLRAGDDRTDVYRGLVADLVSVAELLNRPAA